MFEGPARSHDDRSFLVLKRAHPSTIRAGLFFAQLAGLLLGCHFQGSCQQSLDGCHGNVFHLGQINIQPGTFLAPMLPNDDFPPTLCQFFNALEIFRFQFARGHVASLQQVMSIRPDEILPQTYRRFITSCKVRPGL